MLRNSAQEWILRCIGHNGSIFSNNKIRKAKTKFLKCRCWYRCHFLCWCRDIDNNTTQKKFSIKDFFRNSWCSARFPYGSLLLKISCLFHLNRNRGNAPGGTQIFLYKKKCRFNRNLADGGLMLKNSCWGNISERWTLKGLWYKNGCKGMTLNIACIFLTNYWTKACPYFL